jgi:hypothetical protein
LLTLYFCKYKKSKEIKLPKGIKIILGKYNINYSTTSPLFKYKPKEKLTKGP